MSISPDTGVAHDQAVEVGWTVDPLEFGSDNPTLPHLFVFRWVNGAWTQDGKSCYDGCGFVSKSKVFYPGQVIPAGTVLRLEIARVDGNWQIIVNDIEIGYFPGRLWPQGAFDKIAVTQWFGEVAAGSAQPCTRMGDGVPGTSTTGTRPDWIALMTLDKHLVAPSLGEVTKASYYSAAIRSGVLYFGGPGACPA